jgi:uncharacterized repeat protein (TIGR03803 family)
MRSEKISIALIAVTAMFAATLLTTSTRAVAQTERVLHRFYSNGAAGYPPESALIFDKAGNLYGNTFMGGVYGGGSVFELSPKAGGGWTARVLHSFNTNDGDGYEPAGSLKLDAAGNVYGVTEYGGAFAAGTAFELTPTTTGAWKEKILYNFGQTGTDSMNPVGSLVFDGAGNLYGTAIDGGAIGTGAVFELTLQPDASWTEEILYSFNDKTTEGTNPDGGVIFDAAGNLYGTTLEGGDDHGVCNGSGVPGCGIVYKLSLNAAGTWTETVIFAFDQADGYSPNGDLIFDKAGNLYGATELGGADGVGAVFQLIPGANGIWTENDLHDFGFRGDGKYPAGGLIIDDKGNLWGTAFTGGNTICGCGVLYELSPQAGGAWTETIVHVFLGGANDGDRPAAGLVFDSEGHLYGTAIYGGAAHSTGEGVVFEIRP